MENNAILKIRNWILPPLDHPELSPQDVIQKRWAWIWAVAACSGVFTMTLLTVYLRIWPFLWYGVTLLVFYVIYFPILKSIKNFGLAVNIFCGVVILTTFAVMIQLGGVTTSLGLVFVGLNCAMASVPANNARWTTGLFILYGITVIIAGVAQPFLPPPDYIPPSVNLLYFVLNALWLNASTLFLILLYIKDRNRFEKAENDRLKEIDDLKTRLYTNITHEFRTPLTTIIGIADQIDENPEKWLAKGPRKIIEQSQSLLHLITQMLDFSKLEIGATSVHLIQGDIIAFLKYLVESFHGISESKQIQLKFSSELPRFFMDYDPDKLLHILTNLISNSLKFTPSGGDIDVSVKLTEIESPEDSIQICVKDNGIGIKPDEIPFIFERFYQAENHSANRASGSGLGLSLTQQIVRLLNGGITVDSTPGKGTEFKVSLNVTKNSTIEADHGISIIKPAFIQKQAKYKKESLPVLIKDNSGNEHPVLLIVEDNLDVVEYLANLLEDNYVIKVAVNGKEGLEKAIEIVPDIILSDVMMPGMDGFSLLEELKDDIRTSHIPVVLLTARADFDSKLAGLEKGAIAYLIKPFNKIELFTVLKNILELRRKTQENLAGFHRNAAQEGYSTQKPELSFLQKVHKIVIDNMHNDDFGIEELCCEMAMSRAQVYRKFKALTSHSIGKFIRTNRLEKARYLMKEKGLNVTEAALDSGFKNLSHFSYVFKEEFGVAPSELAN